jgi:hypothetical protein
MTLATTPLPLTRSAIADGPAKLDPAALLTAQQQTPAAPRMHYSPLAKLMVNAVDQLYSRNGSLTKFVMLEIVARVPYQAWERMGY